MNAIKNVLGRIFALWGFLVFAGTMLPVVLLCWIIGLWPEPKRSRILQVVYSAWMKSFFTLTGIRRTLKGRKNFKKGETYVIVCNHNSLADPLVSTPAIPGANRTIAKKEMARIPLFGVVYKRGSILVDRKSEESRKHSYLQMKKALRMGFHMCIYPEGTRNKSAEPLRPFQDGAFRLAVETGKSIIPGIMLYTKNVLPSNKAFFFWPHKVEMHFLPAVESAGKHPKFLKEEVFALMKDYYVRTIKTQ